MVTLALLKGIIINLVLSYPIRSFRIHRKLNTFVTCSLRTSRIGSCPALRTMASLSLLSGSSQHPLDLVLPMISPSTIIRVRAMRMTSLCAHDSSHVSLAFFPHTIKQHRLSSHILSNSTLLMHITAYKLLASIFEAMPIRSQESS